MRRPLFNILVIYIVGIILARTGGYSLILVLSITFLGLIFLYKNKRWIFLLFIFSLIVGYWTGSVHYNRESRLSFLLNEKVLIEGQIIQPPIIKEDKIEVYVKTNKLIVNGEEHFIEEKILGNIYFYEKEDKIIDISEGDIISFLGKTKLPKRLRNPGGFDYSTYLKTKAVYSTQSIDRDSIEVLEKKSLGVFKDYAFKIRSYTIKIIEDNLSKDHGDLLKGIIFGEKDLDSQIRNNFVDSGIAHILAVSGLHVGFLVGFIYFITKILKTSHPLKIVIITLVLAFYILITGGVASVIRASIMTWIYLFSRLISKKYDGISALSLAGLVILIPNPLLLFTASFQLSFMAALCIVIFYPPTLEYLLRIRVPKAISNLLAVTLAAQFGTLPISIFHFHQISLISPITNLLVIPSLGILLIISLGGICCYPITPFMGKYLFFLAGFIFKWILKIADFFSTIPFAVLSMPSFTIVGLIIYTIVLFIIAGYIPIHIKRVKKISYIVLGVLLASYFTISLFPRPLRVTYLDVNQGDGALIECPNKKTILIDGGGYPSYQGDRKISKDVLLPALYSKRISSLDLVIISHPHDDHMKGIEELIGEIPIKAIGVFGMDYKYMSDFIADIEKRDIVVLKLAEGDLINVEGNITIEVLSPQGNAIIVDEQKDINNLSLVVRLDYKSRSFLFTGDIEEDRENTLIEKGKNVKADVLKVPHHGSNTSSSKMFIDRVKPSVSIISVGESNNFNHPNPDVVSLLEDISTKVYRTDKNGAIEIITNGDWIKVKPYIN